MKERDKPPVTNKNGTAPQAAEVSTTATGAFKSGYVPPTEAVRKISAPTSGHRPVAYAQRPTRPQTPQRPPLKQRSEKKDSEAPVLHPVEEQEPLHHRWLLTTCIAGIIGSLSIGGLALGFFGENALPTEANAAINRHNSQLMTASLGSDVSGEVLPERALDQDMNYPGITADSLPYGNGKTVVLDSEISASNSESENITTIAKTPPADPIDENFTLAKGETLQDRLLERGVKIEFAQALMAAIEPIFPVRNIREGMAFELTLERQQDFYGRDTTFPVELSFKTKYQETVTVSLDEDGRFVAALDGRSEATKAQAQTKQINQFRTKVRVGSSIYTAARDNKIPDYIISEMVRIFSYDVDFQRQVKSTDSFEVFYGNPLTGSSTKRKVLHYAQLTLGGVTKTYYRHVTKNGQVLYLDENGRSANRALLKTPVPGSRMTSGFGMRVHPLLGYTKMHTGLDFGVPTGTPIRAAGSGVVKQAGRNGAYGISVEIKHNAKFETLYAHMSKLASGMTAGKQINQGQIIGYVGSTGRSSGPHLHYEVIINGRAVNPLKVKTAGGTQLAGKELGTYQAQRQQIMSLMQKAPSALEVAQLQAKAAQN